jgi:prepilin-type N-terminal cleavage/methylation domain-containing protein
MVSARGFTLMEVMVAILIISIGLGAMLSGLKQQADMRASVDLSKRYLDVARAFRERFDSLRFADIGRASAAGSRSWSEADPMPASALADGVLDAADGGLDEQALIELGILPGIIGDRLRVYIAYRRAVSTPLARGALDRGWDAAAAEPLDWQRSPTATEARAAWDAAENWDAAPATRSSGADNAPIAIRVTMLWADTLRSPAVIGEPLQAAGRAWRRHDITLVRTP